MGITSYQAVLDFWYDPKQMPLHFVKDDDFDEKIREQFLETWKAATEGLLVDWRKNIRGRLAEVIVLDQFSRNLWRNNRRAFEQDRMALALAQEIVHHPDYDTLTQNEKKNALLPFMHSESTALHDWALPYFEALGDDLTLAFEKKHRAILDAFERYPFRNSDLGRESTPEEERFLDEKKGNYFS